MSKLYLAYGSNLNTEQMAQRCPDAVRVGSAILRDYALIFREHDRRCGFATIEPKQDAAVPVGIWRISTSDELSLDWYEGWPFLYKKETFFVPLAGASRPAMVYIMTPGHPPAPPDAGYLQTISVGYKDFGFDKTPLMEAVASALKP